jgi:hypothetical protein
MTELTTETESKVTAAELYFKKVEESLQSKSIQTVIKDISEYCNLLSETKGVKSIEKLNKKHKENLTLLSESCVENYIDIYGNIREDEKWMFMESSYFLSGEGHVTCLLMTQALPCENDFDSLSDGPKELVTTQAYRAVKEFYEEFGASSLYNLGLHTREAFFDKYSLMIPHGLIKLKDKPCDLTFKTKLHYNFP